MAPAWSANGDLHAELARDAEASGRRVTAGEAWVRAALSYHFAKFVWMVDLVRHREAAERAVDALRRAHALLDPTAERIEVPFGDGPMVGNLRRPAAPARPPLVLLLPGLDSTKEEFFHWEDVFLSRGMATLSLDGPGQGRPATTRTSGPTTRWDRPRSSTRSPGVTTWTSSELAPWASRSAGTTRPGRRRSSRG